MSWEVGQTQDGQVALLDPQLQNSYSYARNNPVIGKDPTGRQNMWTGFNWVNSQTGGQLTGIIQNELTGYGQAVRSFLGLIPGPGDVIVGAEAITGNDYVTGQPIGPGARVLAGFSVIPLLGTAGDASRVVRAGDRIAGLGVSEHAADGFAGRNIVPGQVGIALKNGVKYLDTKTNNILHVVGERGRGGYTIVTDRAYKTLVSVEDFVRNLTPKNSPDRFIKQD